MSGWISSSNSSRSMASVKSASSRSASSRAGSYTTSKALTALALDAMKLAMDGGAETKQEGDHFIHLQSELGDRRYRRLCEDGDLALTEIHYCQEGLDIAVRINQEEPLKQVKDLINHDYLVLRLEPGDGTEALHVMAHKLRGGVHVTHVDGSVLHDGVRCFTVQCRKRMRLWALVAILKLEDPDYCLRSSNCWDYAKNTAKRLVKACAEVGGTSAAERARLLKEHDNLETNLAFRHMHNVAKSLIRRFSSSFSTDSLIKPTPGVSDVARISNSSSELSSPLLKSPAAVYTARVLNSSKPPELSSPLFDTSADSRMARVSNISRAPELPSSLIDSFAASAIARVSNSSPDLSSSLFDTPAASDTLARVSNSAGAAELSPSPTASDLASLSARFQDFQQAADPVALVLENPELVSSGRAMGQLSSRSAGQSAAFPLASTGKVCLQIVFLMFWLVLNHLGLGPWVTSLFGRTGSHYT